MQVTRESGLVAELNTHEPVDEAIFTEVHGSRYTLAQGAPICQGKLFKDCGYLANTAAAEEVLNGSYLPPPNCNAATRDLFTEVAAIQQTIPPDSVSHIITPEQWKRYWKVVNEEMSSSESGIHFGHYIVGSRSDIIANYHAAQVTVVLAHAIQLERWSRGMSVMLEKTLGVTLVAKLWAILLMEADFNATNKILYGVRMMGQACSYNLMPDEIYSKKKRMADNGTLPKTLFFDTVQQSRVSATIASVDASNCYDRIAHAIASLIFQSFGVPKSAIGSMLKGIEDMKFFLRPGFGDSKRFAGGGVQVKVQGLTQGNGVSPAGWAVISIVILRVTERKDMGLPSGALSRLLLQAYQPSYMSTTQIYYT